MKIINIQEAKTHLSRLVEEAVAGEEIVVAKAGKPLVCLTPYKKPQAARMGGQYAGKIVESDDCWEPDEDPFEGSLDRPLLYSDFAGPSNTARVAEEASDS
ncbi:MAG: type II toxin-antitoxin system prevent-host-death family antitoxin [Verrucomicrobiae bacterium]|nr:type II toxin-antitoxin system prevent-host-death family antitoxin [Verrucomicrobiae bacterium]MCP5550244.1 type II toxin-antitoxin system prevent-host-death family antitoxin [Akkermansiaceae bacterium]